MDIQTLTEFFMWCSIINAGLILFWGMCVFAVPDLVYRTQTKFVPMSRETFNIAMYSFLGIYKALFLIFNFIPYLALLIIA